MRSGISAFAVSCDARSRRQLFANAAIAASRVGSPISSAPRRLSNDRLAWAACRGASPSSSRANANIFSFQIPLFWLVARGMARGRWHATRLCVILCWAVPGAVVLIHWERRRCRAAAGRARSLGHCTLSNVKGNRSAPSLPARVTCPHSSQTNRSEPTMCVSAIPWAQSCKC